MPRAFTTLGLARLASLPPDKAGDPDIRAVIDVLAREEERLQARVDAVFDAVFPDRDATGVGLGIWETQLDLPTNPGLSVYERQQRVLLALSQAADHASGLAFEQILDRYLPPGWTYAELGGCLIEVTIPYDPGSYGLDAIEAYVREIAPSHLDITFGYTGVGAFLIGISRIGRDSL